MFHILKLINSISVFKLINKKLNIFQINFNESKFVQYLYVYKSNFSHLKIKISDTRISYLFIIRLIVVLSAAFAYVEVFLFFF